jgi:hypothetical protein
MVVLDDEASSSPGPPGTLGGAMSEQGPAVSRLCIAAAPNASGPLSSIQESGDFRRLHLMTDPADGAELAIAAPGLDEVSLISDLIAALREHAVVASGPRRPVVVAFHLGITRLTSAGFGGQGVERALALVRDPAIAVRASAQVTLAGSTRTDPRLAAAITAGFFDDLCTEGLAGLGWQRVPPASAWLRLFDSSPPGRRTSRAR